MALKMKPAVSPSLLERMLMGFKFDPELTKNINFDDVVEQQPLPLAALCSMNYNEDEEYTDQLLLATSQAYEESVASELSQQGNPVMVVVKQKNMRNSPRKNPSEVSFATEFTPRFAQTKPTVISYLAKMITTASGA